MRNRLKTVTFNSFPFDNGTPRKLIFFEQFVLYVVQIEIPFFLFNFLDRKCRGRLTIYSLTKVATDNRKISSVFKEVHCMKY